MKLRRLNRGIALGCVVAIATTGYIIYDQKQFSKNVGDISQSVKDYLGDITDAQTSSDDPKQLCENLKEVINKHMTSETLKTSDSDFYTTPKSEYISKLNSAPKDLAPTVGSFSKYEVKINNIKVSKYGNNGAVANVNYEMVCEYTGNPIECTDSYVSTIYDEREDGTPKDTKQKYRQTKECDDGEFYFNNVDGEWKLCGISTWYHTKTTPINDEKSSLNSDSSNSKQQEKGGADSEQ